MIAFDPHEASHARARAHGVEIASMERVMAEADVVVATTGRAGLIEPEMIRPGQVILALTNPDPEIEPEVAEAAGAAFAADGRSVNNVLGYPGHLPRRAAGGRGRDQRRDEARRRARASRTWPRTASSFPTRSIRRVHDAVAEAVRTPREPAGSPAPTRCLGRPGCPARNRVVSVPNG